MGSRSWQRAADTNAREREAFGGRVAIESVGQLVAAGEPRHRRPPSEERPGHRHGRGAHRGRPQGLSRRCGVPAPPRQWTEREAVRGSLRLFPDRAAGAGAVRRRRCSSPRQAPGGCVEVRPGGGRRFTVGGRRGEFSLECGRPGLADHGGTGLAATPSASSHQEVVVSRADGAWPRLHAPAGGAVLSITNRGEKHLSVCGWGGRGGLSGHHGRTSVRLRLRGPHAPLRRTPLPQQLLLPRRGLTPRRPGGGPPNWATPPWHSPTITVSTGLPASAWRQRRWGCPRCMGRRSGCRPLPPPKGEVAPSLRGDGGGAPLRPLDAGDAPLTPGAPASAPPGLTARGEPEGPHPPDARGQAPEPGTHRPPCAAGPRPGGLRRPAPAW